VIVLCHAVHAMQTCIIIIIIVKIYSVPLNIKKLTKQEHITKSKNQMLSNDYEFSMQIYQLD